MAKRKTSQPAEAAAVEQPEEQPTVRYKVNTSLSSLSCCDGVYPVEDGHVELPKLPRDRRWYQDLIDAGILTTED